MDSWISTKNSRTSFISTYSDCEVYISQDASLDHFSKDGEGNSILVSGNRFSAMLYNYSTRKLIVWYYVIYGFNKTVSFVIPHLTVSGTNHLKILSSFFSLHVLAIRKTFLNKSHYNRKWWDMALKQSGIIRKPEESIWQVS